MQVDDSFSDLHLGVDRPSFAISIDAPGAETEHANETVVCRRDVLVHQDRDRASHVAVGHG
jgi:hypothetical protein